MRTIWTLNTVSCMALAVIVGAASAEEKLVKTKTVQELQIPIVYSAPAEAVSVNNTRISAQISARVTEVPVNVADQVEADAVLVKLDCQDYELALGRAKAQLQNASAQLTLARQRLTRAKSLIERKHISQDILDQRFSELDAATATERANRLDVQRAQIETQRCVIKSPYRAAIIERHTGIGDLANPGTALLDIQDLDRIEVSAQVIPSEIMSLRRSKNIVLEFAGSRYDLRINRTNPVIDINTRSQEVRLDFTSNAPPVGASGRLNWAASRAGLPAHLLVQRENQLGIFVVEGNSGNTRAEFVALPSAIEGRPITTELPGDTRIVTDGRYNLRAGDVIKVAN